MQGNCDLRLLVYHRNAAVCWASMECMVNNVTDAACFTALHLLNALFKLYDLHQIDVIIPFDEYSLINIRFEKNQNGSQVIIDAISLFIIYIFRKYVLGVPCKILKSYCILIFFFIM